MYSYIIFSLLNRQQSASFLVGNKLEASLKSVHSLTSGLVNTFQHLLDICVTNYCAYCEGGD